MLRVRSPPSFALSSSSTSRFSPICSFAGFLLPPLPPDLDDDGMGGMRPKPVPPFSTICSAFLLLFLRRLRRRLLPVVLVPADELAIDSVSLSMRRPDRSRCSGLLARGFVVVVVMGTGPPGPPRRRPPPPPALLLPLLPPPPLPLRREVVLAAEEVGSGGPLGRLLESEEDMMCMCVVVVYGLVWVWVRVVRVDSPDVLEMAPRSGLTSEGTVVSFLCSC